MGRPARVRAIDGLTLTGRVSPVAPLLMDAYTLTLARAGYVAVSFSFEGHGYSPCPMSDDVTRIEGITSKLMTEISRVADSLLELDHVDGHVGILNHSIAADIIM